MILEKINESIDEIGFMATCLVIVVGVPMLIGAHLALEAFVITRLWAWFVTPFGVEEIGFWRAAGLSVLIGVAFTRPPPKETGSVFATMFLVPLVGLLVGWLIHVVAAIP